MKNIILIGMSGVGKSTLGKLLAKKLNMNFLDTDSLIQSSQNMKLQEILNKNGIDYFMKIEKSILCKINVENTIIATGGSAVYYESAMKHLKKNGIIVYLYVPYDELFSRLSNIEKRGIVMEAGSTFKDVYDSRLKLYEKYSDLTIDCSGKKNIRSNVDNIAKRILM